MIHLNVHSDLSIMRGLIKPRALVKWCKDNNLSAACITDYGNISAAVELNKCCKEVGIKPIFGMEANLVEDKSSKVQKYDNVILLAKNKIGFQNLIRLATLGAMYFYYVPRIDFESILKYGEGLIILTGDIKGIASKAYFFDQKDGLLNLKKQYEAFGDDFYFEIEPVPSESQTILNNAIIALSENHKIVATGDCRYVSKDDRDLHKMFTAIRQTKNEGWTYPFSGYHHLKTLEEMAVEFSESIGFDVMYHQAYKKALVDNVQEIVEKIEAFDITSGVRVPEYIG